MVQLTDAQGNVKTMRYDALGRKLHMVDPNKGEMSYTYDDAGNLLVTRDALGQEIRRTYDAAHRLREERWVYNNGQRAVINARYHYDRDLSPLYPDAQNTLGQIAYIEDQAGSVHFSYDSRGNIIGSVRRFKEEGLALVTRLAYDSMDRLVTATFPDGSTVNYEYNERGLLARIPGFVEQIDYLPTEQRAAIRYSNGATTKYEYDARLRVKRLQTNNGGNLLQDLTYTLDNVSNVLSINDARAGRIAQNDQTQSFVYDALYRLLHAEGTYGAIDYGYDSIGNMVQKTSSTANAQLNIGSMRYGENGAGPHALTTANGKSWAYDANGNLRQQGETQYGWDARNQLTSVDDGSMVSSFVYDAEGQRVTQRVQGGTAVTTTFYAGQYAEIRGDTLTLYVFDEQHRVAEVVKPLDRTHLLQGFSDPIPAAPAEGERHWYVADNLGGTSLLLDAQGGVVAEVVYYPFGATRYAQNGGQVHYRFTGHEQDASGLIYANARYYEPVTGRFISVDPLFVEEPLKGTKNPQLLNLYAYALNNPGRYTDPDGTEPKQAQQASMKTLRTIAGFFEANQKEFGYDPDKLLRNPRLSPEMVWQTHMTMSAYHMDEALMANIEKGGPNWTTARVMRGYEASDPGSIYHLGIGVDIQIFDKQGRYVDPTSDQGRQNYATYMRRAEGYGFTTSLVTADDGQSYIRMQYTPNAPRDYRAPDGKLTSHAVLNHNLNVMKWHMQDLRKHVWKQSAGSYWRLRYAMAHPIRRK